MALHAHFHIERVVLGGLLIEACLWLISVYPSGAPHEAAVVARRWGAPDG
jgi:hypothetical protein